MRIASGRIDAKLAFVAVDSVDLKTRKTGLSAFTVYRSRNGGAATVYTTPTVVELSAANMPGVYVLTLDEDTTLATGIDDEEYVVHVTAATMAPVTRAVELYRSAILRSGTLVSASASGCTLEAGASAVSSYYLSAMIVITGGTGAGQARLIVGYLGATRSVTVSAWATTPDATSTYVILPFDLQWVNLRLPAALNAGRMESLASAIGPNVLTAASTAADFVSELQAGLATAAALTALSARVPTALTLGGTMRADAESIGGSVTAAARLRLSGETIVAGVVGAASTLGTVVTSSLDPSAVVGDQFKGRVVLFARDTITPALRGQGTIINASSAAGVLTVVPLTTVPVAGDTFAIV